MRAEPPITKIIIEIIPQAEKILPEDALFILDAPATQKEKYTITILLVGK